MLTTLLDQRYLILQLTKREIDAKYKGSVLGLLWTFITPLAMLVIFSFVFGEIFQAKWPGNGDMSKTEFSVNLFIGLSYFWFFADVLVRAPVLFTSVPNFVKKVVFPLEVLPVVSILACLFQLIIYILITLAASIIVLGKLSLWMLVIPLLIFITLPLLLGITLLLGAAGVFFRDIAAVVSVAVSLLMFLSPVFYPVEAVPANAQWLFALNPLTLIIESMRSITLLDRAPNFYDLGVYFIVGVVVLWAGYSFFNATKRGFADVI